jgi:hypothetical protein
MKKHMCPRCGATLTVFKVFGTPNWELCQSCDAVYDEHGQHRGTLTELEDNGTLEEIENQAPLPSPKGERPKTAHLTQSSVSL